MSDDEECAVMCRFDPGQVNGLKGQEKKKEKKKGAEEECIDSAH
jgi:hypothetical protein